MGYSVTTHRVIGQSNKDSNEGETTMEDTLKQKLTNKNQAWKENVSIIICTTDETYVYKEGGVSK